MKDFTFPSKTGNIGSAAGSHDVPLPVMEGSDTEMALILRNPSHRFWRYHGTPQAISTPPPQAREDITDVWEPKITVRKEDGRLNYMFEVGGTNPEDLDVSISEDTITIKGDRRLERVFERRGYEWREISRSSFCRSLSLPRSVDWEKAEATFEDGVLEVSMAIKVEEPKRIEIRSA